MTININNGNIPHSMDQITGHYTVQGERDKTKQLCDNTNQITLNKFCNEYLPGGSFPILANFLVAANKERIVK